MRAKPYRRPKETKPTTTSLVTQALAQADDFMSLEWLLVATGRPPSPVKAALHWLRLRHAIDSVESGGRLWWFSTPSEDDRTKTLEQITTETITKTRRKPVNKSAT